MTAESLRSWSRQRGPEKVLAEVRRRLERGGRLERGTLRVKLDETERRQVGALIGLDWFASGRDVPVVALRRAIEERGSTLAELAGGGTEVHDLRAERRRRRETAAAERDEAVAALAAAGVPAELARQVLTRRGLPTSGSGALAAFAHQVARTWAVLPGPSTLSPSMLSVLASRLFADPHALDRNTALGRTVARLAASAMNSDARDGDVTSADVWRACWAAVGVVCDEVSSTVLVAGLPLIGDAVAVALTQAAGPHPVWLTLRDLHGAWAPARPGLAVRVCENPSVIEAAAARLGSRCPPLICTFGRPSTAGVNLLRGLAMAGVDLWIRADDDPTGQSIVTQLINLLPDARLWHYQRRPVPMALADPRYEEQVLDILLDDLCRDAVRADHLPRSM